MANITKDYYDPFNSPRRKKAAKVKVQKKDERRFVYKTEEEFQEIWEKYFDTLSSEERVKMGKELLSGKHQGIACPFSPSPNNVWLYNRALMLIVEPELKKRQREKCK